MPTGRVKAGFFSDQRLGSSLLQDNFFEAARDYARDIGGLVIGEVVIDSTLTGLGLTDDAAAINERKITVTGNTLAAMAANGDLFNECGSSTTISQLTEGSRTITLNDPAWFTNLPYENANGTTYRIYLTQTEFPIDVENGKAGGRGYGRFVEVPGVTVNPDTVSDAGSYMQFIVDTDLTALGIQPWLTANAEDDSWSYDCIVWLDTDQPGVEIATDDPDVAIGFAAKLWKRSGNTDWLVNLDGIGDGYLGQSPASTTASHYKITILGPVITTTDFDSNDAYVHIGTTASATGSETHSTTGQQVTDTLSDWVDASTTAMDNLWRRGWFERPTSSFAGGGATLNITAGGSAFISGKEYDPPTASLTSFTINSTIYVYYDSDPTVADFAFTTTLNDAVYDDTVVPFIQFDTDGSGLRVSGTLRYLTRNFTKHNECLTLTVSDDQDDHGAQFDTLENALAFAAAMAASSMPQRSTRIEIVGDCTVAAEITEDDFFNLKNVTIIGQSGGDSIHQGHGEGRIIWSHTGNALFEPGVNLTGWVFENITFRYTGTGTADTDSIIVSSAGIISGLAFRRCLFDGNTYLSTISGGALNGGGGQLAHVLVADGNSSIGDVEFTDCKAYMGGCYVYASSSATCSLSDLKMNNCFLLSDSGSYGTPAGTEQALVFWESSGTMINPRITYCDATAESPCIRIITATNLRVEKNDLTTDSQRVIRLGDPAGTTNTTGWITDNVLTASGTISGTDGIIRIHCESSSDNTMMWIKDNKITGTGSSAEAGILINVGIVATGNGWKGMITGNDIKDVGVGIYGWLTKNCMLTFNNIEAELYGIRIGGTTDTTNHNIEAMNMITMTGENPIAIDLGLESGDDDQNVCALNMLNLTGATGNSAGSSPLSVYGILATVQSTSTPKDYQIIFGNVIDTPEVGINPLVGKSIVSGNLVMRGDDAGGALQADITLPTGCEESIILGNLGSGVNNGLDCGGGTTKQRLLIVGNMMGDATTANYFLDVTRSIVAFNSCYDDDNFFVTENSNNASQCVIMGNFAPDEAEPVTAGSTIVTSPFIGNVFNKLGGTTSSQQLPIVGNVLTGSCQLDFDNCTFVGNYVHGNFDCAGDDVAVAGNHFNAGIDVSSSLCAMAGNNWNGSTATDTGGNNCWSGNVGPLDISGDNSVVAGSIANGQIAVSGTDNVMIANRANSISTLSSTTPLYETATDSDELNRQGAI